MGVIMIKRYKSDVVIKDGIITSSIDLSSLNSTEVFSVMYSYNADYTECYLEIDASENFHTNTLANIQGLILIE